MNQARSHAFLNLRHNSEHVDRSIKVHHTQSLGINNNKDAMLDCIILLVRAPTPDCRTFLADGLGTTGLRHCHGNKVNLS